MKSGSRAVLGSQDLDGDVPLELVVAGAVDRGHAALPEELDQPIAPAEDAPISAKVSIVPPAGPAPGGPHGSRARRRRPALRRRLEASAWTGGRRSLEGGSTDAWSQPIVVPAS